MLFWNAGRTRRMRLRNTCLAGFTGVVLFGVAYAFQRPWREYPGVEYENFPLPPDYREKTEWVFARLMYPSFRNRVGRRLGYGGNWKQGVTAWTTDYPRADRHLSQAIRRLTRVHVRSVEQPVDLDDDTDVYNYP